MKFGRMLLGVSILLLGGMVVADEAQPQELQPIVPEDPKLGRPVEFEQDVFPILENNCVACHNLALKEKGLNLEDIENVMKGGKSGPSVIAGEPDKSPLYQLASHSKGPIMPPADNKVEAANLTPQELGILRQWIIEGAKGGDSEGGTEVMWQPPSPNSQAIYALAVTADGQNVAAGRSNQIFLYDLPTGQLAAQLVDPELAALKNGEQPFYKLPPAHRDLIHSLAFSPDGSILASGDYREVKLWQRALSASRLQIATGEDAHDAISPDAKWLATGAKDNSLKLWNLADGAAGPVGAGHTAPITALLWSVDSQRIYTASEDKTLRIWNLADGKQLAQVDTPEVIRTLAVHPAGKLLASNGANNQIQLWAIADDGQVSAGKAIPGPAQPVAAVAFSGPAGAEIVSGAADGQIGIWNVETAAAVRAMNHGAPVLSLSLTPDGQKIASAGGNSLKIWNYADGKQLVEVKGDVRAQRLVAHLTADDVDAKARVATAEAAVKAAEMEQKTREEGATKATEAKAAAEKAVPEAEAKLKDAMTKATEAQTALDAKKDDAALQKAKADADKAVTDAMAALKTAMDNKAAADRGADAAAKAVQNGLAALELAKGGVTTAQEHQKKVAEQLAASQAASTATEKAFTNVSFSRDGKLLAAGGEDQLIHTYTADGVPLNVLSGHTAPLNGILWANGFELVSLSKDQSARVWNLNPTWNVIGRLGPQTPGKLGSSIFADRVTSLAFSPDGKFLATGGGDPSRSGELMIWDLAEQKVVKQFKDAHSDVVLGLEFSLDGTMLVSSSADKFVKVFNTTTGNLVKSFEGHTSHVLDAGFRGNGVIVASVGADNAMKVWSLDTGEQVRTIAGYGKQVPAIQFVGRTNTVVSCGGDGTVRLHDTDSGGQVRAFGGATDYMYAVAATADGNTVIAGGEDGVLRVWKLADGAAIGTFAPLPIPGSAQAAK